MPEIVSCDYLDLSKEELLRLISTTFGAQADDVSVEKIGEEQGYLSVLAGLRIKWSTNCRANSDDSLDAALPDTVVYKQPTKKKLLAQRDELEKSGMWITKDGEDGDKPSPTAIFYESLLHVGHNNECVVFKTFCNAFPQKSPPIPIPRLYGCKQNTTEKYGYIFMEDLRASTVLPNMVEGLSYDLLGSAFDMLADLHAFCFLDSDWRDGLTPVPWLNASDEFVALSTQVMRQDFGDIFHFSDEEIRLVTDAAHARSLVVFDSERDFVPVLSHGDLWTYNLLVDKDAPDRIVSIIDWQLAHEGSAVEDMVALLSFSASPEVRREYSEQLLERYHARLSKTLRGKSSDASPPFTLPQLKELFVKFTLYGSWFTMIQLPVMAKSGLGMSADDARKLAIRQVAIVEDALEYLGTPL